MATLKISDLSVGDWVGFEMANLSIEGDDIATAFVEKINKPARIKSISGDQYLILAEVDNVDYFGTIYLKIEHILPIPITAEILEKNGFTRRSSEFPIYEHTTLLGKMLRTIVVSLLNPHDYIFCRIEDISKELHEDGRCLVSSNVSRHPIFVHDLQHALRLASIDKEINL